MLLLNAVGSTEFIEAAKNNDMTALLSIIIIVLVGVIVILTREYSKKNTKQNDMSEQINKLHQDHLKQIGELHQDHANKIDDIRQQQVKHEETLNKQWSESARETLQVLNGVSLILEMGEKASKYETDKILEKIENTEKRLIDNINNQFKK